jgi:ferrous iron transport protein B
MLSGFICAVPAILATRTLPQRRDRLLTMMALPLLTCSARLPVYTLLIATLLPESGTTLGIDHRAWVMVLLYLFATLSAFAAVWVMGKTILKGETPPLLIHLPDYRKPVLKDVMQRLWTRAMVFIKEAGSVILVGTIVLWMLLSFPRLDTPMPSADSAQHTTIEASEHLAQQRAQSYGGQLGRLMEPALRPLGWDWQVGVGLIGDFAAREVFVSTLGMVYGVGAEVDEESDSLRDKIKTARHADGSPVFTPTSALALLIFFSLACQCLSTLAAVKRETGGYRWPLFMFSYMSVLAYGCALLVTWIGAII